MTGTATDDPGSGGEFSLDAVLAVFERRDDRARPVTANDVIEELGCCRRTAHNKLAALVERDELATRKVGARSRVWWIPIPDDTDRDPAVEAEIATAEVPGPDETGERHREALRAAYDYLSENPDATETEFLTEVFPEHPAGFETADRWWAVIGPALRDLPNVDVASDRGHVWHYVGG